MPFEVYPIKAPDTTVENSDVIRTANKVADDIKDVYNKVAEQGGQIVAEHHIAKGGDRAYGTADVHWLFLVAETPEA